MVEKSSLFVTSSQTIPRLIPLRLEGLEPLYLTKKAQSGNEPFQGFEVYYLVVAQTDEIRAILSDEGEMFSTPAQNGPALRAD